MESISTGERTEYLLLWDTLAVVADSCLEPAQVFRMYLHYCQFKRGKCDMIATINVNMYSSGHGRPNITFEKSANKWTVFFLLHNNEIGTDPF